MGRPTTNNKETVVEEQEVQHETTDQEIQNESPNQDTTETAPDENYEAPVNKEALDKQMSDYSRLETAVSDLENSYKENSDYRSLKKQLIGLKEHCQSMFLIERDTRISLEDRLQSIFEFI